MKSVENNLVIYSILKDILSDPKDYYPGIVQFEFNCPSNYCKKDVSKYNLAFNSELNIFHCWKCKYKGIVKKIIEEYGTENHISKIKLIFPQNQKFSNPQSNSTKKKEFNDNVICELPEGFISLSKLPDNFKKTKYYYKAVNYLKSRKIFQNTIDKYNIGYTEEGPRKFRIIIPSYNKNNDLNYYEARSYVPSVKPAYLKPDFPDKNDIIFNLKNVNFNIPVYIVEGVFDMFPLFNAIPLLGKTMSNYLISKLVENNTKVILCLDEDARKDAYDLYFLLESFGLDVYVVDIQDDVAKFHELHEKEELIKILKNYKKLDFNLIFGNKLKTKKRGSMKLYTVDHVNNDYNKVKKRINE